MDGSYNSKLFFYTQNKDQATTPKYINNKEIKSGQVTGQRNQNSTHSYGTREKYGSFQYTTSTKLN